MLLCVQGADIYVEVPISISEAVLGGTIVVPTLSGDVEMKVPAGTQSGVFYTRPPTLSAMPILRARDTIACGFHVRHIVTAPASCS